MNDRIRSIRFIDATCQLCSTNVSFPVPTSAAEMEAFPDKLSGTTCPLCGNPFAEGLKKHAEAAIKYNAAVSILNFSGMDIYGYALDDH